MGPTTHQTCKNLAMTLEHLTSAWRANNAVNVSLLELVEDDTFDLKPGRGKTVRSNFVHIIGVRRMWAEEKLPKLAAKIEKLDWKSASRSEIVKALVVSSKVIEELLMVRAESDKPGRNVLMFLAYAVAHEAHHRSQVEIALRINGREPPEGDLYGLWEWPKLLERFG